MNSLQVKNAYDYFRNKERMRLREIKKLTQNHR
jgi:hypothetical protein